MSFRYQRIADFAHSDANNAADKTLAAAKPAPAASSRSRPPKDGAKVRTYDRSRDPKREKVRKTKTVRNPTPPRWRQFVQEKRSAGWDETASSLRDLSDFADYLLDQPTITSGASTLLSNAKSYLARSRGASVNQTDFNALFKVVKMQGVEKAGGTSVQALPVTIEDFGAFNDATDLAIFKLCVYLGVRATTVAKLEPITIVGKFAMFRVLVGTKKGVIHAGKFLLFPGAKAAVQWMNNADGFEKKVKVANLLETANEAGARKESKLGLNSFRVTLATSVRVAFETSKKKKTNGALFQLARAMCRHQGWKQPQKEERCGTCTFFEYCRNWDNLSDLLFPSTVPVAHLLF
jgi:hypothetical protein